MTPDVVFNWPIGSRHGWGVRGAGYAREWPGVAVSSMLGERSLAGATSEEWQAEFLAGGEGLVDWPGAVLVGMGNDLSAARVAYDRELRGRPTIACPVFENLAVLAANIDRLRAYDRIVTASRWNRDVLAAHGFGVVLCHEGVNPGLFNPSVRDRKPDGRFRVFSGGKPEWRKGHDLVIEAFVRFAETHDDAVLVAAWRSPFWQTAAEFSGRWIYGCPPGLHTGAPDFAAWVVVAGVRPEQFELVDELPNWRMAEVYGNVDVAVFPNRCEGGTNFVAMECLACGVPSIVRRAYGQADLAGSAMLSHSAGVDEIVAALEREYDSPTTPHFDLEYWSWRRHCAEMAEIVRGAR